MSSKRFWRMFRRRLLIVFILCFLVLGGVFAFKFVNSYNYDNSLDNVDLGVNDAFSDEKVVNIMLFGIDARNGEACRSDAMMIMSLDFQNNKIKLISLMRDSLVEIEGHGEDKLTHAHFYGGPELAIKTINQNFGLDIEEYATVNFQQMAEIIEAVGGVDIDVSDAERKETNKFIKEYGRTYNVKVQTIKESGMQRLDGIQAMTYARIRKGGTGDDWGRVERQSIVLEALFKRVQSSSKTELLNLAAELMPKTTTSLKLSELTSLATKALKNGMPQIEHSRVPVDGTWDEQRINGTYYTVFDIDEAADTIHKYLYQDIKPGETEKTDEDYWDSDSSDAYSLQ